MINWITECVKNTNSRKYLVRAHKRIKAFQTLLDLISSNDIPALSRLLSNAKKEGWGTSKTCSQVVLAITGLYHSCNFTSLDKDLAVLIYELGGGAALYALNKAPISLPSRHTIAEERQKISLRVTVGPVKLTDIIANIEMLFKDNEIGEHDKVIHTLCQDKIAGDGRLCYLDDTDAIAGLCEHANAELETFRMGSNLTTIHAAVKAVREGRVHVGKEYSVAVFARHAPTDYGAKPVLLMPTCKHGSWQTAALNLQKLLSAWKLSPYGEIMHGSVKNIASDGASDRRRALYFL
ncbi:hypothetical protein B0H16DRAFT_1736694 [Mycena metata]|uniref:Uncharacterized protein n=1 Tax=Mycena metata TaxID=1033252 RepID=A0AAD7MNT9_9AGAR|nr:hypothetical protein B0H16DRAFT_1736694 [Mycena metata]